MNVVNQACSTGLVPTPLTVEAQKPSQSVDTTGSCPVQKYPVPTPTTPAPGATSYHPTSQLRYLPTQKGQFNAPG